MIPEQANDANLIGYLLDALDEPSRAQVQALLDSDPTTLARLEWLRHTLEPLAADKQTPAPPAGLVVRTMARIAEYCCQELPKDLPKAPAPSGRDGVFRSLWRRADVIVAASLLIIAIGLWLPALRQLQGTDSSAAFTACKENLRVFYTALNAYRDTYGRFPNLSANEHHQMAGMVVPVLANAGVLPPNFSLHCPGNGLPRGCGMTIEQAKALTEESFLKPRSCRGGGADFSYAYSLGFKDADGHYYGPMQADDQSANAIVLMADAPPSCLKIGGCGKTLNSPNHGGAGQNVLFYDGSVRFLPGRTVGSSADDIYLNKANQVAAGIGPFDNVLGRAIDLP